MLLQHWDIFCRVIDNFGDIGVSWRLARQLAVEHGATVRLWVDKPDALYALCAQVVSGITVHAYDDEAPFTRPADVVIEAFGCGLPPAYVNAMASRETRPLWIILEYLSAEPWVREHHGLPSPHPQLNLPRYFFFPGFTEGTGGVLRECDLLQRRDAFDQPAKRAWWARYGFADAPQEANALVVSLFAYPHAPYRALLAACAQSAVPIVMAIPESPLAQQVQHEFPLRSGNLELRFMPFVPQAKYDELLWACDVNFVRGEDSFVRAQWAGKPFVWHIYPQEANAHVVKLQAFLHEYCAGLSAPAADGVRELWLAWNSVEGAPPLAQGWQDFAQTCQTQVQGLQQWQERLLNIGDLSVNLLRFCQTISAKK